MSDKPSSSTNCSTSSVGELKDCSQTTRTQPLLIDDDFKAIFYSGNFGNKNVQDHCVYIGNCQSTKFPTSRTAVAVCNYCDKQIKTPINNAFNWERHVTDVHKVVLRLRNEKRQAAQIVFFPEAPRRKKAKQDQSVEKAKNEKFIQFLINMVAMDGLPFSVVEGKGLKMAFEYANPDLKVPSRRTLVRHIEKTVKNDLLPKMKIWLANLKAKEVHLTLDLWSSRQRQSVMGVRIQFIDQSWTFRNLLLSFIHFPGSHTAENIANKIKEILESVGLAPSMIYSVCADNAQNISKALNMMDVIDEKWTVIGLTGCKKPSLDVEPIIENLESSDEDDWTGEEDPKYGNILDDGWNSLNQIFHPENFLIPPNDSEPEMTPEDIYEDLLTTPEEVIDWILDDYPLWARKRCIAHSLQLVVNQSIKSSDVVKGIVERVSAWIAFLHRSPKWTEAFKNRSPSHLDVRSIGGVRWNAVYLALERLAEEGMLKALRDTILDAREAKQCPKDLEIPCVGDNKMMIDILSLLKPIKVSTEAFQISGPTSHLVIGQLMTVLTQIKGIEVPSLRDFQSTLLSNMSSRFQEEMRDPEYIAAAVLDPWQKLTLFQDIYSDPSINFQPINLPNLDSEIVNLTTPNVETATTTILDFLKRLNHATEKNEQKTEKAVKLSVRFPHLMAPANPVKSFSYEKELKAYLEEKICEQEDVSLLDYWRINERRFPTLAKLFRRVISVPACSADVERMFSIAGAIMRYRRGNISLEHVAQLLTYREYRFLERTYTENRFR